ncbi:M12 family metallopeptidase [Kocuria sp. NPDC057446]|uniref:M12 family metallopeptidase n=1 Tax=Kocuria sp. NPDC057446 TaxID=3346137 RepID=UPI00367B72FC
MAEDTDGTDVGQDEFTQDNIGDLGDGGDVRTGYIRLTTGELKALQFSVVGNRALFEGDIVLGTVDELERDTALISGDADGVTHGVGITGQQYRWPNALLPYEIDAGVTNGEARVAAAIAHLEQMTKMRFVRRTAANASTYPNYVHVIRSDGCWSRVGMRGGRQELSLADGCGFGAVVHEFLHALGLWHEQSREDRDSFVTVHWANIEAGKEHNFNQHISDGDDIGPYDYGSIMHYGTHGFSKNGQPTLTPKQAGASIGQRSGLSTGDIAAVHSMYRLTYTVTVSQVFATAQSRNGWAHLAGLGWRQVERLTDDGVTNTFAQLVFARAFDRSVTVVADGSTIYQVYLR